MNMKKFYLLFLAVIFAFAFSQTASVKLHTNIYMLAFKSRDAPRCSQLSRS